MKYQKFKEQLNDGSFDNVIKELYGSSEQIISHQKKRYLEAVEKFNEYFPEHNQYSLFSEENLSDDECLLCAYRERNKDIGFKIEEE